jgi:hypothetical protein
MSHTAFVSRQNQSPTRTGAWALLIAVCLAGCIFRWPEEPLADTAPALGRAEAATLQARYPQAHLIGPVFRRHLQKRRTKRFPTEQWFLFVDASGQTRRGDFDAEGRLTVREAVFLERLPEELQKAYFEGKTPLVAGGAVNGRVWRFRDDVTGDFVYEFEFAQGQRRGVGRIYASGTPARADYFVADPRQE